MKHKWQDKCQRKTTKTFDVATASYYALLFSHAMKIFFCSKVKRNSPCTVPCSWCDRIRASWCRRSVSSSSASVPRIPNRRQVPRRCASCSRRSASSLSLPQRFPFCPCFCSDPDLLLCSFFVPEIEIRIGLIGALADVRRKFGFFLFLTNYRDLLAIRLNREKKEKIIYEVFAAAEKCDKFQQGVATGRLRDGSWDTQCVNHGQLPFNSCRLLRAEIYYRGWWSPLWGTQNPPQQWAVFRAIIFQVVYFQNSSLNMYDVTFIKRAKSSLLYRLSSM